MTRIIKRTLPIFLIISILLSMFAITANAAGSTIAFSKNKLQVGETLTVTVRFSTSTGDPMYALEGYITYDAKILEFVSGENANKLTDGKVKFIVSPPGQISLTQTYTFKAKNIGSSVVRAESIIYVDQNEHEQTLTGSSATVNVINTSTEASSNANLNGINLSVGELTPAFSSNVTSYTVTIPNTETELFVQVSKADPKATYIVEGSKDIQVGYNKRTIIVTAENGATKSYVINVIRLDENGQIPEPEEPVDDNAIEVSANGDTLYIDEDFSDVEIPKGFEVSDYVYEEKNVPSISDGEYVLLYLIDPEAINTGFYVIKSNLEFVPLITVKSGEVTYCILPTNEVPAGYKAAEGYQIGGVSVPAFVSADGSASEFFLVFAKGPGGKNSFYRYDTIDQTLQRQTDLKSAEDDEPVDNPENINGLPFTTPGLIVAILILVIIVLLIAAIIVLIIKIATSGSGKKKKEKKEVEYDDLDSVGFEYISGGDVAVNTTPVTEQTEELTTTEEAEEIPTTTDEEE